MPRPPPRPRPPRACRHCAARKVSCDKTRPQCSRCIRVGLACEYASPSASSGELTIIDETPIIQQRLTRLGRMIADGVSEGTSDGSEHAASNESDPGHLRRTSQTKARYFSPTFFAAISQEIAGIDALFKAHEFADQATSRSYVPPPGLPTQESTSASGSSTNSTRSQLYGDLFPQDPYWAVSERESIIAHENQSLDDINKSLPSSVQCQMLVWAYMAGYHTMKPIFHGPSFMRQAQDFQLWRDGLHENYVLSSHWLAIFTAVLFAGSVVCPRSRLREFFGDNTRETLTSRFYDLSIAAVRRSNFPQAPSLLSLSAFIIIDSTWLREEQPLTCCAFIGVAFRVAQMLGLHREASKFGDIPPIEIQIRRQLWWTLVSLDAQVAFASSLPPIIEPKLYSVEVVSEMSEAELSNTLSPSPNEANKLILGLFVGGKYTFYRKASEFLHLLNSYRLSTDDVDRVLEMTKSIRNDIEERKTHISRIQQMASDDKETVGEVDLRMHESNMALARFTSMVLSMLADKPYAILYGPLRKHNLLQYLREEEPTAISHCRNYLHCFLKLTQCRDFQPWHWCWPGQHQPLHSMMALIADLDDFPDDPLAGETRKLIDLALHMCGNSQGNGIQSNEDGLLDSRPLHQGGEESWRLIRRARDRVWEKSGLDPKVLRCPENADDVSFENSSSTGERMELSSGFSDADWLPQSAEDWALLGDATDPYWALGGESWGVYNQM